MKKLSHKDNVYIAIRKTLICCSYESYYSLGYIPAFGLWVYKSVWPEFSGTFRGIIDKMFW